MVKQHIKKEHNIQLSIPNPNIKDAFEIELHSNDLKREGSLVWSR
jgi:hypothetical protein